MISCSIYLRYQVVRRWLQGGPPLPGSRWRCHAFPLILLTNTGRRIRHPPQMQNEGGFSLASTQQENDGMPYFAPPVSDERESLDGSRAGPLLDAYEA